MSGVHRRKKRGGSRGSAAFPAAFVAALVLALGWAGCSSSGETTTTRFPPAEGVPPAGVSEPEPAELPPSHTTYGYLVNNNDCRCEEFNTADKKYPVGYRFKASYRMEEGFVTSIAVRFENRGADTLFLDPGAVMVASKNVDYQYNNRFIPLPDMVIPPGSSDELNLDGKEVTAAPSWRRIAGEQLTVTLRGMRYGENILSQQKIVFIPRNPLLDDKD